MDISEILEIIYWMSPTDFIVRVPPFFIIAMFKLVFKEKFKLNFSYFLIATIMTFYFCMMSMPVGYFENIKVHLIYFSTISLILILVWWGINTLLSTLFSTLFSKLKKRYYS